MNLYEHICTKVADFNYLFGVINYHYQNNGQILVDKFDSFSESFNKSQVKLRFSLIDEEIKELEKAITDKDSIEVIDALCDILYVVAGAKVYFNLPIDYKTSNNIRDINGITENLDFSLTKSNIENIVNIINKDVDINKILNEIIANKNILSNITDLFLNEQKSIYHKLFIDHLIKIYNKTLDKIVINIFQISKLFDIELINLFDLVHISNMSKVCETESDARETIEWYKINELRYREPGYRKIAYNSKDYYVIYDIETKKILKSIKYNPVKFI
jgi:hypothetical protein